MGSALWFVQPRWVKMIAVPVAICRLLASFVTPREQGGCTSDYISPGQNKRHQSASRLGGAIGHRRVGV